MRQVSLHLFGVVAIAFAALDRRALRHIAQGITHRLRVVPADGYGRRVAGSDRSGYRAGCRSGASCVPG